MKIDVFFFLPQTVRWIFFFTLIRFFRKIRIFTKFLTISLWGIMKIARNAWETKFVKKKKKKGKYVSDELIVRSFLTMQFFFLILRSIDSVLDFYGKNLNDRNPRGTFRRRITKMRILLLNLTEKIIQFSSIIAFLTSKLTDYPIRRIFRSCLKRFCDVRKKMAKTFHCLIIICSFFFGSSSSNF